MLTSAKLRDSWYSYYAIFTICRYIYYAKGIRIQSNRQKPNNWFMKS